MMDRPQGLMRWVPFALVSLLFFHITASTFTSFGVIMVPMIEEFGWTFTAAGFGFTILSFFVGGAGWLPAYLMRHFGIGGNFLFGGISLCLGFALLAVNGQIGEAVPTIWQYFLGAGLVGLGYPTLALVPGVHVINHTLPERRSLMVGLYFTIGGLGGVFGPQFVIGSTELLGDWRFHWWAMIVLSVIFVALAMLFVRVPATPAEEAEEGELPEEQHDSNVYETKVQWDYGDAVKTFQYAVIVAAMSVVLFAEVTVNSWAFAHLEGVGIAAAIAAGALSAHHLINAFSRGLGGALATHIDAKWLLCFSLAAMAIGLVALSMATDPAWVWLFALGQGLGFGLCLFSTAILLVNYFGTRNNPELFGTLHVFTTVAAAGPFLGGWYNDNFGGFAGLFQICAAMLLVLFVFALMMRPPVAKTD